MSENNLRIVYPITLKLLGALTLAWPWMTPAVTLAQNSAPDASPDATDGKVNYSTREFGVWWVEDYAPAGAGGLDLPATRPDVLGLRVYLTSTCKLRILGVCWVNWSSPAWTSRFVYGNTNAWSTDWRRSANGGSENSYIDTVDLAYFAGHGSTNGIIFGVGSPAPTTVTKNDALTAWGNGRCRLVGWPPAMCSTIPTATCRGGPMP